MVKLLTAVARSTVLYTVLYCSVVDRTPHTKRQIYSLQADSLVGWAERRTMHCDKRNDGISGEERRLGELRKRDHLNEGVSKLDIAWRGTSDCFAPSNEWQNCPSEQDPVQ